MVRPNEHKCVGDSKCTDSDTNPNTDRDSSANLDADCDSNSISNRDSNSIGNALSHSFSRVCNDIHCASESAKRRRGGKRNSYT